MTMPFIKNKMEYTPEIIPVPNPYGSKGLIETAVIKNMIGDAIINMAPDKILFFLFIPDTLNATKFEIPKANTIITRNNASITPLLLMDFYMQEYLLTLYRSLLIN
jgi:hypothetical protein